MMKREKTVLIWLSALALSVGMAACGEEDTSDPGTDAGTDGGTTTTTTETNTDTSPDVPEGGTCTDGMQNQGETGVDCGGPCNVCETCDDGVMNQDEEETDCGGVCDACEPVVELLCTVDDTAGCATSRDCADRGDGWTCDRDTNCCMEGAAALCANHGDECSSDTQTTDLMFCDVAAGVCLRRCDASVADDTDSEDCRRSRVWCFQLNGDDETDGVCSPADCDNVWDGCEVDGAPGTCFPVGNGASYCIPGGTVGVGSSCAGELVCDAGLICGADETCFEPCNTGDSSVGADCGDDTCVEAFDNTATNPIGICGTACSDFSTGECAEGEACSITLGRGGLNTSMCQPLAEGAVGLGETCVQGGCQEGLICLNSGTETAPILTCTELCDTTNSGANADCAGDAEVCQPSRIEGLGFCSAGCEPFPRMGVGEYGCPEDTDSCNPFNYDTETASAWHAAVGACMESPAPNNTIAYGASCGGADTLYQFCGSDLGVCYDDDTENPSPLCQPLCSPFGGGEQCGDEAVCTRGFAFGGGDFALCDPEFVPGEQGASCTDAQIAAPCAGEGTVCLPTQSDGNFCQGICRIGQDDDCGGGTTCGAAPFDIPAYMGICR